MLEFQKVVPNRWWRRVPGTSAVWGPPRRRASWEDYRAAHPRSGRWHVLKPAEVRELPASFLPLPPVLAARKLDRVWEWEQGVAELPHGRLLGRDGWVVAEEDTSLTDFHLMPRRPRPTLSLYSRFRYGRPRRLRGMTWNFGAEFAHNFYHCLMDSVPRARLLREIGMDWDEVDHVAVPIRDGVFDLVEQLQDYLGVPREKIRWLDHNTHLVCDTLLQPSFTIGSPDVIALLRSAFPAPVAETGAARRVYIPRRGQRGLTNTDEVEAYLQAHGFEEVDPMNLPRMRRQLAGAREIVAVHGAAVANVALAPAGARLLEIQPSGLQHGCYREMCASADIAWGAIIGESRLPRRPDHSIPQSSEFTLDMADLRQGIDALLAD